MIKKIILLSFVFILFIACDKKQSHEAKQSKDSITKVETDSVDHSKMDHSNHSAMNIEGTYKGVIPCADCEGIKTILTLSKEGTYDLSMEYLGKGDGKPFLSKGSYKWNKEGNKITLEPEGTQYKPDGTKLVQLDVDGNPIEGEIASKFILTK